MTTTQSISLFGEREKGESVRTQNMTAAVAIANIVKSSLGPVGLDKMLVDEVCPSASIVLPVFTFLL